MTTFIHHDGALGDVLLSLPSIRAIRSGHGPVHLAGRPDIVRFLKETGEADAASSSDARLYASLHAASSDDEAREFLGQFERAFVFSAREGSALVEAMRKTIPRTNLIRTMPPEGKRTHVAEYRLKQLVQEARAGSVPLSILPIYRERAKAILAGAGASNAMSVLAIHPGSGGKAKCWPLENYLALIERLQRKRAMFIALLTGPAEDRSTRERIAEFCRTRMNTFPVADEDLMTVAALLAECGLYVGNDSGVSHLASAAGCTVIALFGPTDPEQWRPSGPAVRVVAAKNNGDISSITIDAVLRTVHELQDRPACPFA